MGITAEPKFRTVTIAWPLAWRTFSTPWSTAPVVKKKPRQNQERSWPDTFSIVRKKSAGCGCLNAQRRLYSRNALSKTSAPRTLLRSARRTMDGFTYASEPRLLLLAYRLAGV